VIAPVQKKNNQKTKKAEKPKAYKNKRSTGNKSACQQLIINV
jgi:hypothetical protein